MESASNSTSIPIPVPAPTSPAIAASPDVAVIREYLRDRTIGCPACQYNLRGTASENCPECGIPLRLHLDTTDMKLGPWMLGAISVAMPLGFTFILGVIAAIGGWRVATQKANAYWWMEPWTRNDTVTLSALGGLSVFYLVTLAIIMRRRARFLARPRVEQWVRSITLMLIMGAFQGSMLFLWTMTVK